MRKHIFLFILIVGISLFAFAEKEDLLRIEASLGPKRLSRGQKGKVVLKLTLEEGIFVSPEPSFIIEFSPCEELIIPKSLSNESDLETDILKEKLAKRNVPSKALNFGKTENALGNTLRQVITFQSGIPMERARELVKFIKGMKLKVQSHIQEDKVRVSGKKIDELQTIMQSIKDQKYDFAIQFVNYN